VPTTAEAGMPHLRVENRYGDSPEHFRDFLGAEIRK
jgi:hypothetical protein